MRKVLQTSILRQVLLTLTMCTLIACDDGTERKAELEKKKKAIIDLRWENDVNLSISKSLISGGATGCGFYVTKHVSGSAYLVMCADSPEGPYKYYIALTGISEANGPYRTEDAALDDILQ